MYRQITLLGMIRTLWDFVWTQCEHHQNTLHVCTGNLFAWEWSWNSCSQSQQKRLCEHSVNTVWTPYTHVTHTDSHSTHVATAKNQEIFVCTQSEHHMNTTWTHYEHNMNTIWTRYTQRQYFPSGLSSAPIWTHCEHHMNTLWTPYEHAIHTGNLSPQGTLQPRAQDSVFWLFL